MSQIKDVHLFSFVNDFTHYGQASNLPSWLKKPMFSILNK